MDVACTRGHVPALVSLRSEYLWDDTRSHGNINTLQKDSRSFNTLHRYRKKESLESLEDYCEICVETTRVEQAHVSKFVCDRGHGYGEIALNRAVPPEQSDRMGSHMRRSNRHS
jgi:hypothetical protein